MFLGNTGCHCLRAISIADDVVSSSVLMTAIFELCREATADSSSDFKDKKVESRCIIGHNVVAIPSKVSTLLRVDIVMVSEGGKGAK